MSRKAFTITNVYSYYIVVKSVGTGNIYEVYYGGKIGAEIGDTVTIIIDDNSDKWKTIINERTGNAATISRVR